MGPAPPQPSSPSSPERPCPARRGESSPAEGQLPEPPPVLRRLAGLRRLLDPLGRGSRSLSEVGAATSQLEAIAGACFGPLALRRPSALPCSAFARALNEAAAALLHSCERARAFSQRTPTTVGRSQLQKEEARSALPDANCKRHRRESTYCGLNVLRNRRARSLLSTMSQ